MKWLIANRSGIASADAMIAGLNHLDEKWEMVDPSGWSDHYWIPCDVAVAFGIRNQEQAFLASAKRRGVPTVVVDLGYINRFDENFRPVFDRDRTLQLSIGDNVGIIPKIKCPEDRRIRLGIKYPGDLSKKDGPVLVLGQWPSDPTHPFSDPASITTWIDEIRQLIGPDIHVKYRPHPRLMKSDEFIDDALRSARCAVVWSSNSGNDALVAGIPVAAKTGPYKEIVANVDDIAIFAMSPWFPTKDVWECYFNRLAYGQWSFAELADGSAIKFIRSLILNDDPFKYRFVSGRPIERRNSLYIKTMSGLGDSVFQRSVVKCAAQKTDTVYLKTPWPELYADIENIRFVEGEKRYRTQAKNLKKTKHKFEKVSDNIETISLGYDAQDLMRESILDVLSRQLPPDGSPFVFDLPPSQPSKIAQIVQQPFVIVRPNTIRKEWMNPARNPLPEYITMAVAAARAAGFPIVSLADVDEFEEEIFDGDPPYADFTFNRGEVDICEMIAVVREATGVISGVGWPVPFCLAAKTRLLCVLGGCGAHNAPHIIAPPNVIDTSNITWAIPDKFCMCGNNTHECIKTISNIIEIVDEFTKSLNIARIERRRQSCAVETPLTNHRIPKFSSARLIELGFFKQNNQKDKENEPAM